MTFSEGKTREPDQPQALQYPKDKVKEFWGNAQQFREITIWKKMPPHIKISRTWETKSCTPHTAWTLELEPPQHIQNLLSALHYPDMTVPLSCLLPSALFRATLPQALIVHFRSFWKGTSRGLVPPRVFEFFLSPPILDCYMWSLSNCNQAPT